MTMLACPRCGDLCLPDSTRCECGAALTVKGNRVGRADRMLAVLRDGREHSREEIEQLSPGGFFLTNNAASDLRKRGFDVQHRVKDGLHTYRLLTEGGVVDTASAVGLEPVGETLAYAPPSVSEPPVSPTAESGESDGAGGSLPPAQLALSIPRSAYEAAA